MKNANLVCRLRWLLFFIGVIPLTIAYTGCDRAKPATESARKSSGHFFDVRLGEKIAKMQVAVTDEEMQRGLMERRDLGPDEGMLFVYARPQQMSFWMRNTPTPLDIGFFNREGVLQEIYSLHPFDETAVRSRNTNLLLALEMNQGWFRQNGIKPGAQLDVAAVKAALDARGFKSADFRIGRE